MFSSLFLVGIFIGNISILYFFHRLVPTPVVVPIRLKYHSKTFELRRLRVRKDSLTAIKEQFRKLAVLYYRLFNKGLYYVERNKRLRTNNAQTKTTKLNRSYKKRWTGSRCYLEVYKKVNDRNKKSFLLTLLYVSKTKSY